MHFLDLPLSKTIQHAIAEQGYTEATPIQEKAIPLILSGADVVGCAQTGTGKTAAFAIPIVHQLHRMVGSSKRQKHIRTLVVTPTRELAVQIGESFDTFATYTNLRQLTLFGGVSQVPQVDQLKKGVDILVTTPGRLLDLFKQGHVNLDHVYHLVLDEADQMLDMGFIHDVKKIVKLCPPNRQTLLFSATMPLSIRELAESLLNQPQYLAVAPESTAADTVQQRLYPVAKADKRKLLYHLIRNESMTDVLVFTRTKHGADNVVKALHKHGLTAEAIHSDKSQTARQRVLDGFKNKEIAVLVATDIAARGIDIHQLPYVVNFDLPNIPETYIHRIGRTGRAGHGGIALSFCSPDEQPYWKDIQRLVKANVKTITDHPYPITTDAPKPEAQPNAKPDYRHKKKNPSGRKSANAKKNKKRWY